MAFGRLRGHEELLVALLRRDVDEAALRERVRLLDDPQVRAAFLRDAGQHGVLGLALTMLHRPQLVDALSSTAAASLFAPLPRLRRQAAFWDLERSRVLQRLHDGGVDPVVLKGGALRLTTYTESLERSLGDLDVLVRNDALDDAVAALESADYIHAYGDLRPLYRAHHFHFIMRHPAGFVVELHWALTVPSAQVRLDAEAFRARSSRLKSPHGTRVPSAEDMVLHLICQNLEDGFGKLGRTVDLDRIISQRTDFDWPYLVDAASRAGAHTPAALALQLSSRLLGTRLPAANAAALFGVSRVARAGLASVRPIIAHVRRFERVSGLRAGLLHLWTARGSRSWFWALRQQLSVDHYRFWFVASGSPPPAMVARMVHIGKLLALQVWSFVTALAGLMTRPGRTALRFWTP